MSAESASRILRPFLSGFWSLLQDVKLGSPDYKDKDKEEAINDFTLRIDHYKSSYEPLDETLDRSV